MSTPGLRRQKLANLSITNPQAPLHNPNLKHSPRSHLTVVVTVAVTVAVTVSVTVNSPPGCMGTIVMPGDAAPELEGGEPPRVAW